MAKWDLDPEHTSAVFEVRHMMVNWVTGRFDKVAGTLFFDPLEVVASSVAVEIEASSIYTGHERRDADLRSANYLDVTQYPKITFQSRRVEPVGLEHCRVLGDLFLHGVTRPVTLDVRYAGPSYFQDDERRYTTFGFRATAEINREDFGMTTNLALEQGGFMVGKHFYLVLNAEADQAEEGK